ncbi:MAG: CDP-alcohol phosphatidyltransferase family protein [Deltaproteobacteria bacterium]|nr:CDP-alcohol phosphatidyltransferase family protein [Deltaproteobacteria bacterium]
MARETPPLSAARALTRQAAWFLGACLGGGLAAVVVFLGPGPGLRWLGPAALAAVAEGVLLRRGLAALPPPPEQKGWGLANWLTLGRGGLLILAAGFGGLPPAALAGAGLLVWVPAGLLLAAAGLDGLDGWAARQRGEDSPLGAYLDRNLDALYFLIASLLAVAWSRAGLWFVLVGLAHYLFWAAYHWRRRRGLPLQPLAPSTRRRVVAGLTMAGLGCLLLPLGGEAWSRSLAWGWGVPFLWFFLLDWRQVSQTLPARGPGYPVDAPGGTGGRS